MVRLSEGEQALTVAWAFFCDEQIGTKGRNLDLGLVSAMFSQTMGPSQGATAVSLLGTC